jgi:hypothetical protein
MRIIAVPCGAFLGMLLAAWYTSSIEWQIIKEFQFYAPPYGILGLFLGKEMGASTILSLIVTGVVIFFARGHSFGVIGGLLGALFSGLLTGLLFEGWGFFGLLIDKDMGVFSTILGLAVILVGFILISRRFDKS